MKNSKELLEEADTFIALAKSVQDEAISQEEREDKLKHLALVYHNWYQTALMLFDSLNQQAERRKFEQEYEGTIWTAKILKFLTSGLQSNPLYDPDRPTPLLTKWLYPVTRTFVEPLTKQRNYLGTLQEVAASIATQDDERWGDVFRRITALETSLLSAASTTEQSHQWHQVYNRVFSVFLEKANTASTNHEKKLSYEYLAILLIGSVEGFSIFGHDARGLSEEIDLWVSNESEDDFLKRYIGSLFIVECKNWSGPVGVPQIRGIRSIIEDKHIQFAILMSKNGITGDKYRDAVNLVQKAFHDGRYIVVLDQSDLLDIANGKQPVDKIKEKIRGLHAM